MALDKEDVVKIAHLARLQVADSEIDATTERLSSILGMIEQLQAAIRWYFLEGLYPLSIMNLGLF